MAVSHDDFSRTPVSNSSLRPWWYLLTIDVGALISIPIFFISGKLGMALTLSNLLLSTIIGGLVLGIISIFTARRGAITRCSSALLARANFGSLGAACICLLLSLTITGWWAVQTEMFADAVIKLVHTLFHFDIAREVMVLVGGCAMITTAALGIKAIGRLAYLAAPVLTMGLIYGLSSAFADHGWQRMIAYAPSANEAIGLGSAIATVISACIVGVAFNPDYSRFAINTKQAVGYTLTFYAFCYPLALILCGIMAIGLQTKDLFMHLTPPEFNWLLLIMMMLSTWGVNDCNLYSSSLGLTAVFANLKRSQLAIAAGILGIILAELKLSENMMSFLSFIGILIAPISGVIISSTIDPRDRLNPTEIAPVPKLRIEALLAWLGGALIGYMTTAKDAWGLGLFNITTVPALDAILAAITIMLVIKMTRAFSLQIPVSSPEAPLAENRPYANIGAETKEHVLK